MLQTDRQEQGHLAYDGYTVEAERVEKSFGRLAVLRDVHLQVRAGELYGLIGPSGCGKTTLVKLIAGLTRPNHGRVRLLGVDPLERGAEERARTGYMPQGFFLFPNLTVIQNAGFVAGLYGIGWLGRRRRIRELLQHFELWEARGRRTSELSGGMQRRLTLACSVVHRPEVVFVDEPTAGLDPILRVKIWDYLQALRNAGTTIVVTTQYVEEAAYCDRVGLMRDGRIITSGTPEELRREAFQGEPAEVEGDWFTEEDIAAIQGLEGVRHVERCENGVRVLVDNLATATPTITQLLLERGTAIRSLTPQLPTFNEVFTELINRHV